MGPMNISVTTLVIVCGVLGWAVIELVLWLLSFISISIG